MIFLISLFFSCIKTIDKQNNKKQNDPIIDLPTISKFTMIKTTNGKEVFKIKADKAVLDDKNKILIVYNGDAEVYDKKIRVANLKFEIAKYDVISEEVFFLGKNVITTIEKEKIITYDINYKYKENKIFSEKEIEIYKDNSVIKGIGFETFDGFQTIRIYKNVITTE